MGESKQKPEGTPVDPEAGPEYESVIDVVARSIRSAREIMSPKPPGIDRLPPEKQAEIMRRNLSRREERGW